MNDRLDFIQALRAIAALSVVYFHSHFAIKNFSQGYVFKLPLIGDYGFFGVQLFFIISGFIICKISDFEKFNSQTFLIKRFIRIYPIYFIFCAISFALGRVYGVQLGGYDYSVLTFVKSILVIPQEVGPIYAVGWSLEHEVVFYVVAWFALRLGGVNALLVAYITIFFLSFYWVGWDYRLFSQSGYFLFGIVLYKVWNLWRQHAHVPIVKWRIPSILIYFGDISYSLYLVHWIVFPVMSRASTNLNISACYVEIWRFIAIILSVILAHYSYRFLERPIIFLGNSMLLRNRT
jgi:peptidoglycan/LPS O-acetylase OafA/YrhL